MAAQSKGFELMEPPSSEALVPDHGLWPWYLAAAVVVILVLIAAWLLRKKVKPIDPRSVRDAAFAEAMAALTAATAEHARDAAVKSSLILRKYLAAAAGDPALYETHEEFVSRHDSLKALNAETRAAAEKGFGRLAALKYAPGLTSDDPAAVVAESRTLLETLHHGFAA